MGREFFRAELVTILEVGGVYCHLSSDEGVEAALCVHNICNGRESMVAGAVVHVQVKIHRLWDLVGCLTTNRSGQRLAERCTHGWIM